MYPLIEDVCVNLSAYIDKESADGAALEARELFARYTADVVSNCIFALDARSLKEKDALIQRRAKELFAPSFRFVLLFALHEFLPGANKIVRIPFVTKDLEQFFAKLMRDASELRRQSGVEKADVMQYLLALQERKKLNDVELVANAITFFLDGYETSSIAMSFVMFEVARDKRVQDKLRQEILNAEQMAPLSMDSIADLPYLDQVFHEALRLNSPAPILTKQCTEAVQLALTDDGKRKVTIPKGTAINIPVQSIQLDPTVYKDPLAFLPERFDADEGGVKAYRDKGAYLAFGDGPRICLGMRFAITQVKAGLVEVLRKFEVTVDEKTRVPLTMSAKEFLNIPDGGIWLNYRKL